jgi:hypothetical protein
MSAMVRMRPAMIVATVFVVTMALTYTATAMNSTATIDNEVRTVGTSDRSPPLITVARTLVICTSTTPNADARAATRRLAPRPAWLLDRARALMRAAPCPA